MTKTGTKTETYYYDTETEFYYLQSRYYDPVLCRFLNADGYASTGSGFVGYNMYAYCNNNPVNYSDPTGQFLKAVAHFVKEVLTAIADKISGSAPVYAGSGGLAIADGPLPVGDAIALGISIVLTLYNVGAGIYEAAQEYSESTQYYFTPIPKVGERDDVATIPQNQRKQAYFPINPYDFSPRGLKRMTYVEPQTGKNGGVIKWEVPGTSIPIFEWDEDYKCGSHYHVMGIDWDGKHRGLHYLPGSPVPEPWNSVYFGG